jgi:HSP20 family protein
MTTEVKEPETKVEVKPEAIVTRHEERPPRRFDPFEMFDEMQDEMARLWSQTWPFMPRPLARPLRRLAATAWTPRMDVFEKGGNLMVKAELPGLKREDIEVTLVEGDLVIRGERKAEHEVKEEHYYRMERSYGSFFRRVPLDFAPKAQEIKATYKDGVLEIVVPRPAETAPRMHKITLA